MDAVQIRPFERSVTHLRINVLANNAPARRAYERYGFAPYEVMYEKRIARA